LVATVDDHATVNKTPATGADDLHHGSIAVITSPSTSGLDTTAPPDGAASEKLARTDVTTLRQ